MRVWQDQFLRSAVTFQQALFQRVSMASNRSQTPWNQNTTIYAGGRGEGESVSKEKVLKFSRCPMTLERSKVMLSTRALREKPLHVPRGAAHCCRREPHVAVKTGAPNLLYLMSNKRAAVGGLILTP